MSKKVGIIALLLIIAIISILLNYWRTKDLILEYQYDFQNNNTIIKKQSQIDEILHRFETYKLNELDSAYVAYTKYKLPKYVKLSKKCKYYKITRKDLYKYLVHKFRLKHILPKDRYYKELILGKRDYIYFSIRKEILYKLLILQNELKSRNYNHLDLFITNGYRHPYYNELVGGATFSWHIRGAALDLEVLDINNDRTINKDDKQIVIDILEKKVIKNQGGIGKYPGSRIVHFDVRGYRARWDKE